MGYFDEYKDLGPLDYFLFPLSVAIMLGALVLFAKRPISEKSVLVDNTLVGSPNGELNTSLTDDERHSSSSSPHPSQDSLLSSVYDTLAYSDIDDDDDDDDDDDANNNHDDGEEDDRPIGLKTLRVDVRARRVSPAGTATATDGGESTVPSVSAPPRPSAARRERRRTRNGVDSGTTPGGASTSIWSDDPTSGGITSLGTSTANASLPPSNSELLTSFTFTPTPHVFNESATLLPHPDDDPDDRHPLDSESYDSDGAIAADPSPNPSSRPRPRPPISSQ